jgi:hypothetical protein
LLKSNSYTERELPEFSEIHIPELLKYRNEDLVITNFPHNPISSLYGPECKLGMYVLWTIESIRAVSTKSERLIGRFPSQNPILALRDSEELVLVFSEESHAIAAEAYYEWYYNDMIWEHVKTTDPLEDTDYRWH